MIVGVLLMAVAGTLVTYGVRSRSTEEASTGPGAVATAPAEAPTAPRRAVTAPTDARVVHTDVYFDFKSTRLRSAELDQELLDGLRAPLRQNLVVFGRALVELGAAE